MNLAFLKTFGMELYSLAFFSNFFWLFFSFSCGIDVKSFHQRAFSLTSPTKQVILAVNDRGGCVSTFCVVSSQYMILF